MDTHCQYNFRLKTAVASAELDYAETILSLYSETSLSRSGDNYLSAFEQVKTSLVQLDD